MVGMRGRSLSEESHDVTAATLMRCGVVVCCCEGDVVASSADESEEPRMGTRIQVTRA